MDISTISENSKEILEGLICKVKNHTKQSKGGSAKVNPISYYTDEENNHEIKISFGEGMFSGPSLFGDISDYIHKLDNGSYQNVNIRRESTAGFVTMIHESFYLVRSGNIFMDPLNKSVLRQGFIKPEIKGFSYLDWASKNSKYITIEEDIATEHNGLVNSTGEHIEYYYEEIRDNDLDNDGVIHM